MRDASGLVVIGSVIPQNATQLRFVEHDQVIEAFAPNRADEALTVAVLPRRAWRGRVISDPHCTNAAGIRWAECAVAVANQVDQPLRRQRKTVSGCTMIRLSHQCGHQRDNKI